MAMIRMSLTPFKVKRRSLSDICPVNVEAEFIWLLAEVGMCVRLPDENNLEI